MIWYVFGKHCGESKRRICSEWVFSPYHTMFSTLSECLIPCALILELSSAASFKFGRVQILFLSKWVNESIYLHISLSLLANCPHWRICPTCFPVNKFKLIRKRHSITFIWSKSENFVIYMAGRADIKMNLNKMTAIH